MFDLVITAFGWLQERQLLHICAIAMLTVPLSARIVHEGRQVRLAAQAIRRPVR